jgi:hypothetical protein
MVLVEGDRRIILGIDDQSDFVPSSRPEREARRAGTQPLSPER